MKNLKLFFEEVFMKKVLSRISVAFTLLFLVMSCSNDELNSEGSKYGNIRIRVLSGATGLWIEDAEITVICSSGTLVGRAIPETRVHVKQNLSPSLYTVIIEHPAYFPDTLRDLQVRANNDTAANDVRLERKPSPLQLSTNNMTFTTSRRIGSFDIFHEGPGILHWGIRYDRNLLNIDTPARELPAGTTATVHIEIDRDNLQRVNGSRITVYSTDGRRGSDSITINTSVAMLSVESQPADKPITVIPNNRFHTIGDTVFVVANNIQGYRFVNWRIQGGQVENDRNASTNIVLNSGIVTVIAEYEMVSSLNITVNPEEAGTTSPSGNTLHPTRNIVTVNAFNNIGFIFHRWEGNVATENTTSTTIDLIRDEALIAHFRRKPATVTGVSVSASSANELRVRWNAVPNAVQYLVYRGNSAADSFSRVGETHNAEFNHIGLDMNTTVFYRIVAVDNLGTQSYNSVAVSGRTLNRIRNEECSPVFTAATTNWSIPSNVRLPARAYMAGVGGGGGGQGGHYIYAVKVCMPFTSICTPGAKVARGVGGAGGAGASGVTAVPLTTTNITFNITVGQIGSGGAHDSHWLPNPAQWGSASGRNGTGGGIQ
jgi:hypothetical protein